MRVPNDGRELGEELRELAVDLAPDGPGAVLLLGGGDPAGHDVVGVHLGSKATEKDVSKREENSPDGTTHTAPRTTSSPSLLGPLQCASTAGPSRRTFVSSLSHQPGFSPPLSQITETHLHKGHVLGQLLPDILHPLPGDAQGTEVCHQPPHALLRHEGGQHVLGIAQQQVEGDVQLRALLQ